MDVHEALKNLDHELAEMTPHEAVRVLEELYQALPTLIFMMKLTLTVNEAVDDVEIPHT